MNLRERLIKVAKESVSEGVESSKDMIQQNTVPSFDDMGMANVEPGEFAQGEITNQENLVNTGAMSNDNDFNGKDTVSKNSLGDAEDALAKDLTDISAPEEKDAIASVEITKTVGKKDEDESLLKGLFGESRFAKMVETVMDGKTCEERLSLVEGGDWAGPKDFVPDTRINVSDVQRTLKNEIGDGSEGIHVDQLYDDQKNNAYKVSQIDNDKLPKKITVGHVVLELDGDTYKINKVSSEFPVQK